MNLTPEQTEALAKWFAAGASLDEMQKRLSAEFGVHVTYLDLRLFVADLPQPEENDGKATSPQAAETPSENAPNQDGTADGMDGSPANDNADNADPQGDVSVTIDPITPPGVMAGGSVTFSDGTSGKWYLDQMGRLGLGGVPQGYRPSPEDAALFQSRLMEALQSKGLM